MKTLKTLTFIFLFLITVFASSYIYFLLGSRYFYEGVYVEKIKKSTVEGQCVYELENRLWFYPNVCLQAPCNKYKVGDKISTIKI